jgi:hypothetical protein
MSLLPKSVELSEEVYEDWIDVDSQLDVTMVLTEEEICNVVMNSQTINMLSLTMKKKSP